MEVVSSVEFGFMTAEEVRKQSIVKITNPDTLNLADSPLPGGLYDPAMGPLDCSPCKSCSHVLTKCSGHYGHIELVSPAYNPFLVDMLNSLLNKTCFNCFHFRSTKEQAANCVSQLKRIQEGDIVAAKKLSIQQKMVEKKKDKDWVVPDDIVFSDDENHYDHKKDAFWDSFLMTESKSVMTEFLNKKEMKCQNCKQNNPRIAMLVFGWFHVKEISSTQMRSITGGDDNPSGSLFPSEVRDILRRLWEHEAPLCSYICDIQHHQNQISGNIEGYSMFFLENILVPPTKFRFPTKSGNLLVKHPQTIRFENVLQKNIALGGNMNNAERSRITECWMGLQQSINSIFDVKAKLCDEYKTGGSSEISQFLDGRNLFRRRIMGKTVNFTCRCVVSPDPYLKINEIGIPHYFALRLTYPERVTPWNTGKLRDAVINGPEIHPGATTYHEANATIYRLSPIKAKRVGISRRVSSLDIVNRHLRDGDIVLVNRQPTLHKPSIMAHVVRVLKGERTFRMHYANCSSYNAHFDGDEINVHFPQDEISRAEAYNIVNADEQYNDPTKDDTMRGLIQDHIVAAVLLTMKNTFLTWSEFSLLLYGSGVFAAGPGSHPGHHSPKVSILDSEGLMESALPAVWKPEPLWTGKQVVTALLNRITRGCAPCTVKNQGKVPKNYFASASYKNGEEDQDHNAEHDLLIWKNELVRGVMDKAQFGKFGLVHTVQELYGSKSAGILLSALSRLSTIFLQFHGFTCGLDDLIILPDYDHQRKEKLEGEDVSEEVLCDFVKFESENIEPKELQLKIEKVICMDREPATAYLDMKMKDKLTNRLTKEGSQILNHLLTAGLLKPFPKNCMSLMTTTGAEGSSVNFQQISAYLGQQELEGKRVPQMVSGKTLPSFPPWDLATRAGGFITDRFFTGLRPQEYYFHCMAGREGLAGTAVKTSRSGYLLRCLIKNLESLKVCYDYTVRDSDGSIVQFYYGEDGVDVLKTSFLKNFKALEDNRETIKLKFQNQHEFNSYINELPKGLKEEARCFIHEALEKSSKKQKGNKRLKGKEKRLSEKTKAFAKEQGFLELVKQKYLSSLAEAGEPVGVIAAQSIGKLSTQMTLDSFHLAGRGEMNVTLGIPRLQEILTVAPDVIKTPILTCPFLEFRSKDDLVSLVSKVQRLTVADLLESMEVQRSKLKEARIYKLKMKFKDNEVVSINDIKDTLNSVFLTELEDAIKYHVFFLSKISDVHEVMSEANSISKKGKGKSEIIQTPGKKLRWAVNLKSEGLSFEIDFRFTTEPHVLLAQIAQKIAKKVSINKSRKMSQCRLVQYDPDEETVIWDNKKKPKSGENKQQSSGDDGLYWGMKASGVDFKAFWEMHDDLDLRRLYSNNVRTMLNTYGVEAARATLIREVKQVFDINGLKIDFRHLSLIADYMTHTGGYRPMSRHGSISESLSPFLKMSFGTETKFVVEAASHGLTDNLETPSSRICLGLPVKVGTGCFDLMQKLCLTSDAEI